MYRHRYVHLYSCTHVHACTQTCVYIGPCERIHVSATTHHRNKTYVLEYVFMFIFVCMYTYIYVCM